MIMIWKSFNYDLEEFQLWQEFLCNEHKFCDNRTHLYQKHQLSLQKLDNDEDNKLLIIYDLQAKVQIF